MLDAGKARKELQTTSMSEVEHNTALMWGGRAVASFRLCTEAGDRDSRLRHLPRGRELPPRSHGARRHGR